MGDAVLMLKGWADRITTTGPADPEDMTDEELAEWWADEALYGASLVRRLLAQQ